MLKVFFTVDTEIWCDGWDRLDQKFTDAFSRYVYGPTRRGNYGLPVQLRMLNEHGLRAVFFVEPLFAARFGVEPLRELVGLISDAGQEVQLHLHTEWVDEATEPLLPGVTGKRQHLRHFGRAEQAQLIASGSALLQAAGSGPLNAFRAGNFGLNADTLAALAMNGIGIDSSYNAASAVGVADVAPGRVLTQPETLDGVCEYPVTTFRDGGGRGLRHLQLTACSFAEMRLVLDKAADTGWDSVVIVSHNFELLNRRMDRPDPVVVRRMERLCGFLARHSDRFCVCGFHEPRPDHDGQQRDPLRTPSWMAGARMAVQAARRLYG